jgi:GH25 family lysozyme M1 (1,4-beta-N-acetylmuramidase)
MRKIAIVGLFVVACGGGANEKTGSTEDSISVCPGGATVEGVDVSEFQGNIDWGQVRASGRAFAFIRVADGHYFDPYFDQNWSGSAQAGVLRGAYQFFRPGQDGASQADFFLQHAPVGDGDLPPVLDVEVTDGQSSGTIVARIGDWVQRIHDATGRTPIIYTAPGFWNGIGGASSFGADLWVAHWFTACPSMPYSWGGWSFWQYSDNGGVPGIGGAVDLDRFNGSLQDLQQLVTHAQVRPAAVGLGRNQDGRLEAFVEGSDHQLWHQWQVSPGGAWSGFAPMTGSITGTPAVVSNADGRLEVFVHGADNQVWHQWQWQPNGTWSGFFPMTGNITDSPAVIANADGRLEVFVRGSDAQLWHQWQVSPGGGWNGGFAPMAGNITDTPAVARNADGRLEVFVRGSDGQLWHQWQWKPGSSWSGFFPMTGCITDTPAAITNADGRLEVFVRGCDAQLWHQWQSWPGGSWSGFWPMTGNISGSPSVSINKDGRLEVFVRGSDNHVWHQWQWQPNSNWSGFVTLNGTVTDAPSAIPNADGRIEVFVRGADWGMWHDWQIVPNGSWFGFASLGGVLAP